MFRNVERNRERSRHTRYKEFTLLKTARHDVNVWWGIDLIDR